MSEPKASSRDSASWDFVHKFLLAVLIVVTLLAVWTIVQVFVLGFAGIVVAVALRNMAAPIARYTRLSDHWALLVTTLVLLVMAIAFFVFFGALAADQFTALIREIPGAIASARNWLQSFALGKWALSLMGTTQFESGTALLRALPLAGGVLGGLSEASLVLLLGIYLAADPNTYVRGAVRLFPPHRRDRVAEILEAMGVALHKWLIGQALDMLFVSVVIMIGLGAVGVPLPLALGVLTGVSVFVPYIGPIVATIPGLLLALSVSPVLAAEAGAVYAIALAIEGNVTQPLLQKRAVSLSPVINLLAIVGFGVLFGLWGVILATPLTVALSVLIKMAYIEDLLESDDGE